MAGSEHVAALHQITPSSCSSVIRSGSRPSRSLYTFSLSWPRPGKRIAPGLSESRNNDVLHPQGAEILVLDRGDGIERLDLGVAHQLFDVVVGAIAAPACSNADITSSTSRARIQLMTMLSSWSPWRTRSRADGNHGCSAMSGRPTSRITRPAIDVALVEIATQRPSRVWYVLRGALFGERCPCRPGTIPSWS